MRQTILLGVWAIVGVSAQSPDPTANARETVLAATPAARESLNRLRKLVTIENFNSLGFETREEVARATLGEPVASYFIRLDDLRKYRAGSDPNGLLNGGDLVIFPVLVNGEPRLSIEVTRDPAKGWTATGFGGARFIRLLQRVRAQTAQGTAAIVEVRVPALRAHFAGLRTGGELQLVPLTGDPGQRWRAGVAVGAREILTWLAADANHYNGLPL